LNKYDEGSALFKALADPVRLQIVDMLAQGEMCACDLLQNLPISQPTLSHHMKALRASGLVSVRKQATWMHYSLNLDDIARLQQIIGALISRLGQPGQTPTCVDPTCCSPRTRQRILTRQRSSGDGAENHIGDAAHEI
jgi:ArsR family transcriptional regulator